MPHTDTLRGADIRRLRESVHLSQAEIARRLSYTRQHLCHIEHDRKRVTPQLWRAFVDVIEAEHVARATLHSRTTRLAS